MFPVIPFSQALLASHCLIDVRTPLEFDEDHIPGAINIPLLTNEERVEIGTIHKQVGPHQARIRGLEMTAGRFPEIVREAATAAGEKTVLVYCWRGGLRSRTVATILALTGHDVCQLKGGYKIYRQHVIDYFASFTPPAPLVVMHGLTGSGKTDFITRLSSDDFTVIDLEGIAQHRGSAFGQLGIHQEISQKRFESVLWHQFQLAPAGLPIILEGESRRIGRIALPDMLYEKMRQGLLIWCEASMNTRVDRLIAEYGKPEYREELTTALDRIRKKLGGESYQLISVMLANWDMPNFMQALLERYYDRLYYKVREWTPSGTISLEDHDSALTGLKSILKSFNLFQPNQKSAA